MAITAIDRTAKQHRACRAGIFPVRVASHCSISFHPPIYWTDFLMQSDVIGVGSLPIVILSGFFTGGVLALQSAATLSEFGATASRASSSASP
jgi:phospholipid/cholesterol/gamma-HCH transport system permease protein